MVFAKPLWLDLPSGVHCLAMGMVHVGGEPEVHISWSVKPDAVMPVFVNISFDKVGHKRSCMLQRSEALRGTPAGTSVF